MIPRSSLFLSLAAALLLPAQAGIQFTTTYEADTKWFSEPWSADARAAMESFLSDLGAMFDVDATVRVSVTDNTTAYASAGSTWSQWYTDPATGRMVIAPGLWLIVVKGITNPGAASDVTLNWNLDVNALYGGNPAGLINNIRGLGRHEMHHAFGCASYMAFSPADDTRGQPTYASVVDTLYRDKDGQPLLGAFNSGNRTYTMNNFALEPNWQTGQHSTGLYFEGRDKQGRVVKMPAISYEGDVDFSHIKGIAYANDHPTWNTYVDTDLNFLRAMGYPLMADSQLRQQSAPVSSFTIANGQATLNFPGVATKHYRLASSTDLKRWKVAPTGTPGTGAPLTLTHPVNTGTERKRFFQVIEVAE
jgi:hypothetical protein